MKFIVRLSNKIYCEAEIEAPSLNAAYDIAIDGVMEGNLNAKFLFDTDQEIETITEKVVGNGQTVGEEEVRRQSRPDDVT